MAKHLYDIKYNLYAIKHTPISVASSVKGSSLIEAETIQDAVNMIVADFYNNFNLKVSVYAIYVRGKDDETNHYGRS